MTFSFPRSDRSFSQLVQKVFFRVGGGGDGSHEKLCYIKIMTMTLPMQYIRESTSAPGGGGYFRNFWVGMCRWDP